MLTEDFTLELLVAHYLFLEVNKRRNGACGVFLMLQIPLKDFEK